jgi:hypothetical protein
MLTVLDQLLPAVCSYDDLLGKITRTLWESKGKQAAPLFMSAPAYIPGLLSFTTAFVMAEKFISALPVE